jgi:ABC-type multidrug transport system ATPase subunit
MKQKLALSCALIHKPTVLFLDEPTTGVDPVSRREFWDMLKRLKQQGITILVSTPYMDEATLCDRIALIRDGQFLKIDTPQQIINQFSETLWAVSSDRMSQLYTDLQRIEGIKSCFAFGSAHHVTVDTNKLTINELHNQLVGLSHTCIEITPIEASIEDCFMAIN